jgi:translocation and assembly module TamB
MTGSPSPEQEPNRPEHGRSRRRFWRRVALGTGITLVVVGGVAARLVQKFVDEQLAPLISRELSKILERPVEVGEVESIGLTHLRIGPSRLPATEDDLDQATVEAVEAQFNPLEALFRRRLSLNLTLEDPELFLDQTEDGTWVNLPEQEEPTGEPSLKVVVDTVRIQNATATLAPFVEPEDNDSATNRESDAESESESFIAPPEDSQEAPPPQLITFEDVTGQLRIRDDNNRLEPDFVGFPANGGQFQVDGEILLDPLQVRLVAQGQELPGADLFPLLPLPLNMETGTLWGNLELELTEGDVQALNGTARFQDAIATIEGVPSQFNDASGRLRFQGKEILIEAAEAVYGQIPARASGSIHLEDGYNLTAEVRSARVSDILETFDLPAPVPVEGAFDADLQLTGALEEPLIDGTAQNSEVVTVDRVEFSDVATRFLVTTEFLAFPDIIALPVEGGRIVGSGRVTFEDERLLFDIAARDLPGDALARSYGLDNPQLRLGALAADVQLAGTFDEIQTGIQWRMPEGTYTGSGEIVIAGDRIQINNTYLVVAGGTVTAQAEAVGDRWQGTVSAQGVQLRQFSPDLDGLFSGNLQLSGSLSDLSPGGVRASGTVNLSEGIALLNRPITAAIEWTGDRLNLLQATAPGFQASGFIAAQLEGAGAPAIANLNLDVDLQDYAIADLPIPIPPDLALAGQADFSGQVQGTPEAPIVVGQVRVNGLAANDLQFEPVMTGSVDLVTGEGLALDLAGDRDRIALQLDGDNRPVALFVRQDDFIATGTGSGTQFTADVENFPIATLNLSPAADYDLGPVSGMLNGEFVLNLADLANPGVVGEVAIANPAIGYIEAESFTGRFRYANGTATLQSGELIQGESRYLLSGTFVQGETPEFRGNIEADRGRLQDVLVAMQWFDIVDFQRGIATPIYDSAEELDLVPVGVMGETIMFQLRRYSEIVALRNQQRQQRQQASRLPPLSEVQGEFSGTVTLANLPASGFTAEFDLTGQDWSWGPEYRVAEATLEGSFADGSLTLFPVRLQTGDRFLAFSGQIGGEQQSGQLRIQNIPVAGITNFVDLPVDIEGDLNATATLAGSIRNPQVLGELNLTDTTLNDTDVDEARAAFGFNNARLNFAGQMIIEEPEPLVLTGSIPLAFQFMDTEPMTPGINLLPEIEQSDEIAIDIAVKNEGLALLNVLSRGQLQWEGGEGEIDVTVSGTLQEPLAEGIARFDGGIFAAQVLPDEPLTDVTGVILFNTSVIQVSNLQGQFGDGQVQVEGTLPIFAPAGLSYDEFEQAPTDERLLITLERLNLQLPGPNPQEDIYRGMVDGQVILSGAALAPQLGGTLILSDGRIFLPSGAGPVVTPADPLADFPDAEDSPLSPPRFQNLRITLGDRLLVTQQPILNFVVAGDMQINGTLDDIRPEGVVRLRSGRVNLFTTQFNLARGYPSQVVFSPEGGITNPFLDVRLSTVVPEVTRTTFQESSPFAGSETADQPISTFGALQTVRIQASVQGPADQVFDNLELTSNPRRTEGEIIGLLGGGFVDTLGQGDGALAIANLAGSAFLTSVQNFISNTLGLTEFRLFPTTITAEEERTSSFGVAAELGYDITPDLTVSALQILTDDSVPTQFTLGYRLTDELRVTTSSNFSGESRILLEFSTRF